MGPPRRARLGRRRYGQGSQARKQETPHRPAKGPSDAWECTGTKLGSHYQLPEVGQSRPSTRTEDTHCTQLARSHEFFGYLGSITFLYYYSDTRLSKFLLDGVHCDPICGYTTDFPISLSWDLWLADKLRQIPSGWIRKRKRKQKRRSALSATTPNLVQKRL